MAKASYQITRIREDGVATRVYTMEPTNGQLPAFKPGQFVKIFFPGNDREFRMFSIASPPDSQALEFCIKILPEGKFSQILDKAKAGDVFTIEGPFGHFAYEGAQNCALVAAGTGIAPVLSMLRHIVRQRIAGKFTLLFTNKTEKSILYREELEAMSRKHPGIHVVFTLTQEAPETWNGERGRINAEMVGRHIPDPGQRFWYFCGPVEFVKTIKDYALGKGVHPQRIKMEGWG